MAKKQQINLFEDLDEFASWKNEWEGMPEFVQEDQKPYQRIIVSFETKEDLDEFSKLINQKITYKTLSIWFPNKERDLSTIKIYQKENES
jgi:hypothetical protein